ncbi:MAG: hypothetical protein HYZ42_14645, partial [Bacteroidetes bacterium]|nr:hypothetical protein [Bacteroidota bacterium]
TGDSIDAQVTQVNIGGLNNTTVSNPAGKRRIIPAYCTKTFSNLGAELGITNVTIGTINNTTTAPTTGTTNNYTSLSTDIQRKSSQTIQVQTGTYTYYNHMSVYIDYNQDGTFGTGEKVAEQVTYTAGGSQYNFSNTFTVPCTALLGTTRMRVINQYNTAATGVPYTDNPCGTTPSTTYGEIEDYTVNITDNSLTYVSSTAITPSTLAVSPGSANNEILKIQVINAGCTGPLTLTSFDLNTNGSTDPGNDIDSIKIFWTGNSSTFATTTLFGATGTQSGAYTMTGAVNMNPDTNYFHLVYKVATGATSGDVLDAQFVSDVTNTITYYPSISSPSGDRTILNPMTYTSSTVAQPMLGNVNKGSTRNVIMQVQVVMSNGTGITADSISFNSTGSSSLADFNNMRLFYTGTSSSFATTTQLSTVASAATTFKMFAGNTLAVGTNYYWLTYDIVAGATTSNKVDATINYVKIAGTSYTPSVTTISGDRNIIPAYCAPSSTAQCCGFAITNVTLGSINNTTTPETTSGTIAYHNYTSQMTNVKKQASYSMSVTPGTYTGGNQNIAAWIDWNNDGDFADAGEKIGEQTNLNPSTAYSYNFTVPCSAATGTTVMRLKHQYATTNIDPCANGNYVDVEDYTLNIQDSALNVVSVTTQQNNLTDVAVGTTNAEIARIKILTGGCSGSLGLTNLNLSTSGSTNASDIDAAKVYFTGNSNVLAFSTQFGSTISNPSGSFSVSGSQNLVADSNFFFVVYDINSGSTLTDVVDVQCSQATIAASNYTPSVTSPSGNRQINSPMTYSSHSWSKAAGAIQKGSSNIKMATVVVNMGSGSSINLDSLVFNTGGSQNPSTNITNAKVYFTGSSSTFATTTQYGSTIATPSGVMNFNGTAALQTGANYFHLAYNISATANSTTPDSLTADMTKLTIASTDYSAFPSSIAGKRKIIGAYCLPSWANSYVGMGISTVTIGSINNVTGTPSGTGTTKDYTSQSTTLKRLASNSMRISNSTYDYYNTMSVWIDYNQDGVWQTTERVFMNKDVSGSGNNVADTFNFTFAVPCNAALGSTRMRVMMEYNGSNGTDAIGCGGVNGLSYGEAEDYMVDITDSAMSIASVTTQQVNLNSVAPNANNAEIGRVKINTVGCGTNQILTNLNLSTSGTTDAANDLTGASVYFTGNSNVLALSTQFGTTTSNPNGSFSVTGSQTLASDSNFFFVTYNIASGATTGGSNVADVQCSQATITSSNYTPTVTSPSGSRTIDVPMTYNSNTWTKDAGSIQKGATNLRIATVAINMNSGATINLDSIEFNTGASQNASTNITNAKVFFTGSSSTYSTSTQYGSTVATPSGAMKFNGVAALQTGVNYFHLAYTVSATANSTTPDSLTGDFTKVTIAGTDYNASSSIAGKRRIINAYCQPSSTAQCCGFAITNVTLGSINNSSTIEASAGTVAYHNYQSLSTNVTKSRSYGMLVTPGTYASGNQNIAAWVDWNSDGDFDDAGEKIGEQTNLSPNVAYTYNFTVPCGAVTGSTVMRLKHQYATTGITPCSNGNYIDVEDYTLYINDSARSIVSIVDAHPSLVDVATGTTAVQMQRVKVMVGGCSPSYALTSIDFDNGGDIGTTNVADITNAKAYYTTTSAFNTTTQFGSTISAPSTGTMTFSGSQLLPDSSWFWLTYDVSGSATIGNALDAKVTNMVINSSNNTPTNANPTGARYINNPMTYVSASVDMPATTSVTRGSLNATTVRLAINMSATGYPIKIDSIYARLAGSTNISTDLQNAKVFYTGNSSTFATTTQLGSTVATPTGALLFSSSTVFLANNVNYFWLTSDVKSTATIGDSMTGVIDSFRTNLTTYIPSPTTVATKRKIVGAYCTPASTTQCCGFAITNVTLGSINNTTTPETVAANAYHNYTSQSTSVTKSSSYTISVTPGTYASGNQNIAAWIDWNQDGDFYDSGEKIGELTNMAPNTAYNYNFTVPCAAITGTTRMRLVHQYATTNIDPCVSGNYVDAEDYTIDVQDFVRSVTAVATSSASTQSVGQNTTNNAMLRVKVSTGGCSGSLNLTQLDFNTNGSTDATNDITNAKVFYTAASNVFATTTTFGSTA